MLLIDAWSIETTLPAHGLIPPPTFDIKHVLPSREGLDCNHLHSAASRSEFFETQLGEWMVLSHLCPNALWDWKKSLSFYNLYISKNIGLLVVWVLYGLFFLCELFWARLQFAMFPEKYTRCIFLDQMSHKKNTVVGWHMKGSVCI